MHLPRQITHKAIVSLLLADALAVGLAFLTALALRFDGRIPAESGSFFLGSSPLFIMLYWVVNYLFRLYGHLWRYAGAQEVVSIVGSVATSTVLLAAIMLTREDRGPLPLSVIILGGLFAAGAFIAVRYRNRLLTGFMARLQRIVSSPHRCRVLIVGAGDAGQFLARQLKTDRQSHQYELVGFVDDDPQKQGLRLHGAAILGPRQAIPKLAAERVVNLIVIAIHNISGPDMRQILSLCMATSARIKMLPDMLGSMDSARDAPLLKDVTPVDLLGRQPYQIDRAACAQLLAGQVVLVTGAAGSIGSELCRQILTFNPRRLLLLDNNETGLYDLTIALTHCPSAPRKVHYQPLENTIPLIADVRDQAKLERIFKHYRPQLVFHAAAYKHVPLMEQQPEEAVRVNVLGTQIVSQVASRHGVERFVFISTDKAINPSSIMGATKRLAEMMIACGWPDLGEKAGALHPESNGKQVPSHWTSFPNNGQGPASPAPLFTAVRFGNVLDSRGSVVPIFTRQIELGGPVTITHPDMTRYFITIPEAVSLVIQAATLTRGGDIFMLDMGQEIRIVDLAHKIIRLRGLRPGQDVPLEIIGIRPGEKLHEELVGCGETWLDTAHPKIYRIQPDPQQPDDNYLSAQVDRLIELAGAQKNKQMVALLWQLVKPETEPVTDVPWS